MDLTTEQLQALQKGESVRLIIAGTPCVVIREDLYEEQLDNSPWTDTEINLLADEVDLIISQGETDGSSAG